MLIYWRHQALNFFEIFPFHDKRVVYKNARNKVSDPFETWRCWSLLISTDAKRYFSSSDVYVQVVAFVRKIFGGSRFCTRNHQLDEVASVPSRSKKDGHFCANVLIYDKKLTLHDVSWKRRTCQASSKKTRWSRWCFQRFVAKLFSALLSWFSEHRPLSRQGSDWTEWRSW